MTDRLRESVSALIDGEADELELRRLLTSNDFSQVRDTWSEFQRARGGLNGIDTALAKLDISARVQAALAHETVSVAVQAPQQQSRRWWRPAASVAVAASMAAIVVMGARNFTGPPNGGVAVGGVSVADAGAAAPANAGSVTTSAEVAAISPSAGKVFPAMPSPLRGSSTVSANYGMAPSGNGNIVVPVQMYGSSQARAEAEVQLRRRLQTYLLLQVEREASQQAQQQQAVQNP